MSDEPRWGTASCERRMCDYPVYGGSRQAESCKNSARYVVMDPRAPWSSENKALRVCGIHKNLTVKHGWQNLGEPVFRPAAEVWLP